MIKDDKQYQYSKECANKFAYSIAVIEKDEAWKQRDPERWQLDIDVKRSHLIALQSEIDEYERLINCEKSQPIQIKAGDLFELLDALIKARIAAKMSQKELADILGFEEERIKQCEANNYRCATVSEIIDVSAALGIEFENVTLKVDFEEIESGKNIALEFKKRQEKRNNIKAKA